MQDIYKEIIKAKQKLYSNSKQFATSIKMTTAMYQMVKAHICYKRTDKTKLSESVQGLIIIIDDTLKEFELAGIYDPFEDNENTSNN